MKLDYLKNVAVIVLCIGLASVCSAQTTPAPQTTTRAPAPGADTKPATPAEPEPTPLSTPAMTGPLSGLPPVTFDAGPFGKLAVNGIISGTGLYQGGYHSFSNEPQQAALSNGQVWIQKTDGWWQFYVQAGAYNLLSLGTPYLETDQAISNLFGPLPVGFLKLVPGKNTSILIGALPTLIGAEYTFSFQNMHSPAWLVVEPGKCGNSRSPDQSDAGESKSFIFLGGWLLFQPLLLVDGPHKLHKWAP